MLALHVLSEAGPDGSLSWLLFWVLGIFLVIIIVGWLASQNKTSGPEAQHEAHEHADEPVKAEKKAPKLKLKRRK